MKIPATHLRDIPIGQRFILIRTRQIFTRIEGNGGLSTSFPNATGHPRVMRQDGSITSIHHSTHVKPIYKLKDIKL